MHEIHEQCVSKSFEQPLSLSEAVCALGAWTGGGVWVVVVVVWGRGTVLMCLSKHSIFAERATGYDKYGRL